MSACEVLLVLETSICGHEDFKSRRFGSSDQVAVLKFRPSALTCRLDRVSRERPSKLRWRALVEANLHSGGFKGTSGRMFEYGSGLLGSDAWKPLDELV